MIQKGFKCEFEPFKRDMKQSNGNSNDSKGIQIIQIQIQTTRKGLEAFEHKFKAFERDSKHLNANSNHSKEHQL